MVSLQTNRTFQEVLDLAQNGEIIDLGRISDSLCDSFYIRNGRIIQERNDRLYISNGLNMGTQIAEQFSDIRIIRRNNKIKYDDWCINNKGQIFILINNEIFLLDYVKRSKEPIYKYPKELKITSLIAIKNGILISHKLSNGLIQFETISISGQRKIIGVTKGTNLLGGIKHYNNQVAILRDDGVFKIVDGQEKIVVNQKVLKNIGQSWCITHGGIFAEENRDIGSKELNVLYKLHLNKKEVILNGYNDWTLIEGKVSNGFFFTRGGRLYRQKNGSKRAMRRVGNVRIEGTKEGILLFEEKKETVHQGCMSHISRYQEVSLVVIK